MRWLKVRFQLAQPDLPAWEELEPSWREVVESGRLTAGAQVASLEAAVARSCGVAHCVAVANCTLGLQMAMGLFAPGEVILPAFAFVATAQSVAWARHRPVFVDCDPSTFTVSPEEVAAAVTAETRAICAVNVFGVPPDMDALREVGRRAGVPVVVDSAQGLGSRWGGVPVGGLGTIEVFSLSPAKVVTGAEGGLLTTDDAALAARLRAMGDYGRLPDGEVPTALGTNGRMSELHAALAGACLGRLEAHVAHRRRLAEVYRRSLEDVQGLRWQVEGPRAWSNATFFVIVVESEVRRAQLGAWLEARGIETRRYFWPALHRHPSFGLWGGRTSGSLERTEALSAGGLALPLHRGLSEADCEEIAEAVREGLRLSGA